MSDEEQLPWRPLTPEEYELARQYLREKMEKDPAYQVPEPSKDELDLYLPALHHEGYGLTCISFPTETGYTKESTAVRVLCRIAMHYKRLAEQKSSPNQTQKNATAECHDLL